MVALVVARQGRQLQRYTSGGGRLVVGCIPYKVLKNEKACDNIRGQSIQVLVISSQKGHGMMFPKGGWETDETMTQAALREAMEEAGVEGDLEEILGKWTYKSRSHGTLYEGFMFPLNVTDELLHWPEMTARKRKWVSVAEVMEGCEHTWMKEALESLVRRVVSSSRQETNPQHQTFSAPAEQALIPLCA